MLPNGAPREALRREDRQFLSDQGPDGFIGLTTEAALALRSSAGFGPRDARE